MADLPSSSGTAALPSIATISPAKTCTNTNQKNITNFFRVTTPTPATKRENSDLKATPKKSPQLPPKNIVDEKSPSVVAPPEVFVIEESEDPTPIKVLEEDPPSETPAITSPDVKTREEISTIAKENTKELPVNHETQEILQATVQSVSSNDTGTIAKQLFTEPPTDSTEVEEISDVSEKPEDIESSKKRTRKKTQKYSDDQPTPEYTAPCSVPSTPPMSPELTERLDNNRHKVNSLLQSLESEHSTLRELLKSSRQSDFLVITGALDNFLQVVDDSEENLSNFLESFTSDIKKFTQLFVQDDISPLTNLHSALKIELDILREKIVKSQHPHGNTIICALSSCDTLEYLKEIARRVSYGYRSSTEIRESSHFDDQSNAALWRWELVVLPDNFPHCDEIKAIKAEFTRVGKAVKAIFKVISEITKCSRLTGSISAQDEVKINSLEDKVTAAMGEIQKSNDKKAALLKKKIAQEVEAEKRLKRKEELAAAKVAKISEDERSKKRSGSEMTDAPVNNDSTEVAGDIAPKKKVKPLGEKEMKEIATLEKQKSMLMNFFTSPTSKSKKGPFDSSPLGQNTTSVIGTPSTCDENPSENAALPETHRIDVDKFEQYLKNPLSMPEIFAANKMRYSNMMALKYHKAYRKPKTLSVTVTSHSDSAWDNANNYAEIKDIHVDSRKRLFSFAEDYRPAYFGTFSKRSRIVTGRRPFLKDPVINYGYDSEAEWEEEDPEGEDIAVSDNEVDDEGDEIIYDDFFCRDNEVENIDGELSNSDLVAPSGALSPRMTVNGVRFIGTDMRARVLTSNGDCVEMTSHDIDTETLLNYSAILQPHLLESEAPESYTPPRMCVGVPRRLAALGASLPKSDGPSESSKESKDSRNFKDSMLPSLAKFVHGKKDGVEKLVDGFIETLQAAESIIPPKAQIKKKILELAEKKKGGETLSEEKDPSALHGSSRWRVHNEIATKLDLELPPVEYTPQKTKGLKRTLKLPTKPAAGLFASEESPSTSASATPSSAQNSNSGLLQSGASESAKTSLMQYFQPGKESGEIIDSTFENKVTAAVSESSGEDSKVPSV